MFKIFLKRLDYEYLNTFEVIFSFFILMGKWVKDCKSSVNINILKCLRVCRIQKKIYIFAILKISMSFCIIFVCCVCIFLFVCKEYTIILKKLPFSFTLSLEFSYKQYFWIMQSFILYFFIYISFQNAGFVRASS